MIREENAVDLLKKRPLAAALFAFFAGSFLLANLSFVFRVILFGILLLTGTFLLLRKKRRPVLIASSFLVAVAAVLSLLTTDLPDYAVRKRKEIAATYTFRALEQTDEENNVWLIGSVKDGDGALFCRLSVDLPDGLSVKPGDRLESEGTVASLSKYARSALYGRGCRGRLYTSGDVQIVGHSVSLRAPFQTLSVSVRETLHSRVEDENGGLLVAVLLGETEELPTGTALLFRRAGISHALAVSGMHLVFLCAALSFLFRRLGLPRPAVGVSVILFAFFYAALVGFTPSVLRASLMLFFYEGSWFAKRQPDSLTSLALSGFVMLLFAPYLIASVSFLLSYLATLGILLAAQFLRSPVRKRSLPRAFARKIVSYAVMTLFAVLFTLPVSCSLFGELPLLSIPANLLLSVPVQCLLYLAVAVLVLPFPFVGRFASRCCALFLSLLRKIAALPASPLTFSSPLLTIAGALPILALLAVAFLPVSKRKRVILCSGTAALTLAAFLILALPVRSSGHVVLCSDGSDNDAILLRSGTRAACVDLGNPDGVLPLLEREMKRDRIGELDCYVFTGYGDGAAERFSAVLSSVYIRQVVLTPPGDAERNEYVALLSLLEKVSVDYTAVSHDYAVFGYALAFTKYKLPAGSSAVPLTLTLDAGNERLFYLGNNVPVPGSGFPLPDRTAVLFLGSHGETRFVAFRIDLPDTVRTLFTDCEFYTTCEFTGGSADLRRIFRTRLVPDGFRP